MVDQSLFVNKVSLHAALAASNEHEPVPEVQAAAAIGDALPQFRGAFAAMGVLATIVKDGQALHPGSADRFDMQAEQFHVLLAMHMRQLVERDRPAVLLAEQVHRRIVHHEVPEVSAAVVGGNKRGVFQFDRFGRSRGQGGAVGMNFLEAADVHRAVGNDRGAEMIREGRAVVGNIACDALHLALERGVFLHAGHAVEMFRPMDHRRDDLRLRRGELFNIKRHVSRPMRVATQQPVQPITQLSRPVHRSLPRTQDRSPKTTVRPIRRAASPPEPLAYRTKASRRREPEKTDRMMPSFASGVNDAGAQVKPSDLLCRAGKMRLCAVAAGSPRVLNGLPTCFD